MGVMSDRETAIGGDRSSELMTLAPDPLGRFDEGVELVLLVLDGDNVADDGGRKAALGLMESLSKGKYRVACRTRASSSSTVSR